MVTVHLQNRDFSIRLRDAGFVLYLGSQIHFGENRQLLLATKRYNNE